MGRTYDIPSTVHLPSSALFWNPNAVKWYKSSSGRADSGRPTSHRQSLKSSESKRFLTLSLVSYTDGGKRCLISNMVSLCKKGTRINVSI